MSPEERKRALALMATSGATAGASVIEAFQANLMGKEADFEAVHTSLVSRIDKVADGDMGLVESMLMSQATALQTIFSSLARRAAHQQYLKQYQTCLTLALKAQAQSRATLEALIELKQPRQHATFVKQANIAAGHQQVNNMYASALAQAPDASRTETSSTEPNRLLEADDGKRLDTRTTGTAGGADPQLEAVGAVNRAPQP